MFLGFLLYFQGDGRQEEFEGGYQEFKGFKQQFYIQVEVIIDLFKVKELNLEIEVEENKNKFLKEKIWKVWIELIRFMIGVGMRVKFILEWF